MTLDKIIDYVNLVLNKEQKGNSLKPSRINTALQAVNIILYEREYQRAGETSAEKIKPLYDVLVGNRAMKRFVVTDSISLSGTGGTLPTNFREQLKAMIIVGSIHYPCEFVSEEKIYRIRFSLLETPKTDEYFAVIRGATLAVYPNVTGTMTLNYLRKPITPVYDYCLGTQTDQEYYMPVGSVISHGALKLGSTVLQNNVISNTGLIEGYTSLSVELDWDEAMHVAFANEILLLLGVNLQDQLAVQHAQNERMIK